MATAADLAVPAQAGASSPASLDALLARETVWRAGRAPLAAPRGEPTGFDALDALLPQGGWPCAALTELLLPADGVGELALLLPTLARLAACGGRVVLVAPPYLPYAPAWRAAGVDLSRLHVVDADPRGAAWAFEQCLRSAACAAVLGWPAQTDAQALRRLQVAAGTGECLGFAFRDRRHARNPSPAALRMEAVRAQGGGFAWQVRKCRGGPVPAQAFAVPPADASGDGFLRAAAASPVRPPLPLPAGEARDGSACADGATSLPRRRERAPEGRWGSPGLPAGQLRLVHGDPLLRRV